VLDQIVQSSPDRVALVVWHASSSYPLYRQQAWDKWHLYPPPMNNGYYYPWLWVDGYSRGYLYYNWPGYIAQETTVTTPVELTDAGTSYDPGTRQGVMRVACRNDSDATITAAVQFAVTEDSIYYAGPNGDTWHNNVFRQYWPGINGTPIALPAGAVDTVAVPFTIDTSYVEARCKLVVHLQDMVLRPDSSLHVYQGHVASLLSATGVGAVVKPQVTRCAPQATIVRGVLRIPPVSPFTLHYSLFSLSGRKVLAFSPGPNDVSGLAPGVYFIRESASHAIPTIVVVTK
jgi:hypothetical protein